MGKKVSDFVLCFGSRFAYSEAAKVWPIYRRRIEPSNGHLMWLCVVSFGLCIIGASLSEPLLDELAGALFWYIIIYIYIYIYIYLYPQSILVPREPPVNAQRANVKPAE